MMDRLVSQINSKHAKQPIIRESLLKCIQSLLYHFLRFQSNSTFQILFHHHYWWEHCKRIEGWEGIAYENTFPHNEA